MSSREIILAQEQGVLHKSGIGRESQGSLVLTNKRVLFVGANTEEVFAQGLDRIRYADVEDLDSIGQSSSNISIPLETIVEAKGSKGVMTNPNLKLKYNLGSSEESAEFVQTAIGGRKKNLNDWAKVIDDLKGGKIVIKIPTSLPEKDSLEGRIIESLSDLQEKGIFEIEEEIETKYKLDLDPDKVEQACGNLVSKGILERKGSEFYRLPSPLGMDDLSS